MSLVVAFLLNLLVLLTDSMGTNPDITFCAGIDTCQNTEITCTDDLCEFDCTGDDSCQDSTFICSENTACYFNCDADSSCENIQIILKAGAEIPYNPHNGILCSKISNFSLFFSHKLPKNYFWYKSFV